MKEFFFFLGAAPIMTATHAATFSSTTLHEDQAKLTALAVWGEANLAVGTAEGLLLHLAPPDGGGGGGGATPLEPVLRSRVPASAKKHAIVQLAVAEACHCLVVLLADGTITSHDLPSLSVRGPVGRSTDCTSIALRCGEDAKGEQ